MEEAIIIVKELENGIKVIYISGQLHESNIDEKIQEIYNILEKVPQGLKLIIDFENLNYINSKAIGYFIDINEKVTNAKGKFAISGAKANVLDVLQVVGLTEYCKTYENIQEAISDMG